MNTYITKINEQWYAFAGDPDNNQVYSIGRDSDRAKKNGCNAYFARWTDKGIEYVSSASPSRSAAVAKAHRAGEYKGEY